MPEVANCPLCGKKLKHLHCAAHGMLETHISGTERFECECGWKCLYSTEAEKFGLKFVLDVPCKK